MADPKKDNPPARTQPPAAGQTAPPKAPTNPPKAPPVESNRPAPSEPQTVPPGQNAKGQAQRDEEADRDELADAKLAGTNEPTPSGVQRETKGPAHQPPDPQQTTQGRRPEVGGGDVRKSHPFNPQMNPEGTLGDEPAAEADQSPEDAARQRAAGGPVFVVQKSISGVVVDVGAYATIDDFPPNTDFDWLLRQKAILNVDDLQADGPRAARMTEEHLAEIDDMQQRIEELSDHNDAANKEIRRLRHELRKARGVAMVHRAAGPPKQTVGVGGRDDDFADE